MKRINDEALIKRIGFAVHEGQKPLQIGRAHV